MTAGLPQPALPQPALPRRDPEARARLRAVAEQARPLHLARSRTFAVPGPLGELLPGQGLRRGTVVGVDGAPGAGATSVAFSLAAAATSAGEWAAAVDLTGTLGAEAAAAAGVALDRFPVVRLGGGPASRWATVVAALLDGVGLVLAEVPPHVRVADARRLIARARERRAVLVVLGGVWPGPTAVTLVAEGGSWSAPGQEAPNCDQDEEVDTAPPVVLPVRTLRVQVAGRGEAARVRHGALASSA